MTLKRLCATLLACASGTGSALLCSAPAMAQTITEFALPGANSRPFGMTTGPDGAVWFVENSNKIGRITSAGAITEFTIPTANGNPQCIVTGPDGALWFVEGGPGKIGRITTAGVFTEFTIPLSPGATLPDFPQCLTVGADGALWFGNQGPMGNGAASGNGTIGRITTAGVITKFAVPSANTQPNFIAAGPDGALWFTYANANKIGRITLAGVVTEFNVPTPNAGNFYIVAGSDGALWFTEVQASKIGRITTAGAITEFALPANTNPGGLAPGPDGALWYTQTGIPGNIGFTGGGQKIGRITTSGVITEYAIPTANSVPTGITQGPDGAIWFAEYAGNKIGRLVPSYTNATSLATGFTLLGNDAPITVATTFGNPAQVTTVWKWVAAKGTWAFYSPTFTDGGAAFAASKGYDFLTTINGGEGFWVNAAVPFTTQLPSMR